VSPCAFIIRVGQAQPALAMMQNSITSFEASFGGLGMLCSRCDRQCLCEDMVHITIKWTLIPGSTCRRCWRPFVRLKVVGDPPSPGDQGGSQLRSASIICSLEVGDYGDLLIAGATSLCGRSPVRLTWL
jgi:hypothetical protein